jgi:hypothetical protein
MPIARKRKATALDDQQPRKQTRSTKTQKTINAFSTVTKAQTTANEGKKRKTVHVEEEEEEEEEEAAPVKSTTKSEKRKREANITSDDETKSSQPERPKRAQLADQKSSPHRKRVKTAAPPTPQETPSKTAAALFNKLNIDSLSRPIPIAFPKKPLDYDTPPDTPAEESELDLSFPRELEDLQDLHASFLAACSMYYSHNGTSTGIEINALLPTVTKHWKKRAVTLPDIQRMLAVVSQQDREFILEDCGRAGVRLTRAQPRGRALKRNASYIDEEGLNTRFEDALQQSWREWQSTTSTEDQSAAAAAAAFIAQLPRLEIAPTESTPKLSPIFTRGEQRLADIKASQAAKTTAKAPPPATTTTTITTPSPHSRSTALFDRIRAKQHAASHQPAGPTKAELERRSALQRIEDVARVLCLLCGRKDRCTFSMQAVTQQVRQSLRNPVSAADVWTCVTVMAAEITPEFVRVVRSGDVLGVVVTRAGAVEVGELRARVRRACVREGGVGGEEEEECARGG